MIKCEYICDEYIAENKRKKNVESFRRMDVHDLLVIVREERDRCALFAGTTSTTYSDCYVQPRLT